MKTKTPALDEIQAKNRAIQSVYEDLKNREINPSGEFDNAGRWYSDHRELISVRSPSRAYPYSQMVACRTKKYVKAIWESFDCKSESDLRANV